MALGAILAAALTDHSARSVTLTVGGVDVVKQPGSGTLYGVEPQTVELSYEGPGGVSSLSFDIDDPLKVISLAEGMEVQFYNAEDGEPLFYGWVQAWTDVPSFGNQGIIHRVVCAGAESLLDWTVTDAMTIAAGTPLQSAVLAVAANVPARVFGSTTSRRGDQAGPVGHFGSRIMDVSVVIAAGTTVRNAIEILGQNSSDLAFTGEKAILSTIDMYLGLRAWQGVEAGVPAGPNDYVNASVSSANTPAPANLQHTTDPQSRPHSVLVVGANAAGTGRVSDGTGLPGPTAVLNDTTSDTVDKMNRIGATYLATFAVALRGTFQFDRDVSVWPMLPGCQLQVTNVTLGLASLFTRCMGIRRTWVTWDHGEMDISYGALRPSGTRLIRKMTKMSNS